MKFQIAFATAACAAMLFAASAQPGLGAAPMPPAMGNAQNAANVDMARHPAEMMAFSGAKMGDKVVEFVPGGGYVTRLFSKAVGPTGRVYSIELASFPDRFKDAIKPVTGDPAYSNVTVLVQDAAALKVPEPADIVWISENYHDFKNNGPFKTDTNAMNKAVFAALKPGGHYVISDYTAQAGSGVRDTQSLHRIDPEVIKSEVMAAGFTLEAESSVLANASDPRTERSHQGSDQVFLKFRKPG